MSKNYFVLDDDGPSRPLVRPSHIKLRGDGSVGDFGKREAEETAGKLLTYFQSKDSWSFTITELFNFFVSRGWNPDMMLYGLSGVWEDPDTNGIIDPYVESDVYLILGSDGRYRITNLFLQKLAEEH